MRNELETTVMEREIERCEDCQDLKEILRKYEGYYLNWQKCINSLLDASGLSYHRLAEKCGISKNTLKKWCREGGAPRSRNTFLKLGFGLGMNPGEVSRLLVRYGGYHGLYAKDLFDAVCIYTLQKRSGGDQRYSFSYSEKLYQRCVSVIAGGMEEDVGLKTEAAFLQISAIEEEEDFLRFSAQYGDLLQGRGKKLTAYLEDFLRAKAPSEAWVTGKPSEDRFYVSDAFRLLGLPKRFEKVWSQLSVHGVIPRREVLIAFALHLEMTPEETNRLLRLAGMEGLCVKDRMECVILYALQQLCLHHPDIALSNAIGLLSVTKDQEQRDRCRGLVEEYMKNCYQCSAEEVDTAVEYVRELLVSLDMEEAQELLELL